MPAMYKEIERKLNTGELILLDGGTGTEIQRKGAPMSGEVWCAPGDEEPSGDSA